MLSNLQENGEKYTEKCNFYIKYFDKIKCYADRPYLVFSELKPETHIYFFFWGGGGAYAQRHVKGDHATMLLCSLRST